MVGSENYLTLDAIQCQTVLSKCLGSFDLWKEVLIVTAKSGYNVIHFTPVQELGASKSAYSLKDQLKLNPTFSTPDNVEISYSDVEKLTELMRTDWNVLSITDIVLNHTANETPWLQEHPECGYNLANSPHLRPAFYLDRILWHTTVDIVNGRWQSAGLGTEIDSEEHLSKIRHILLDVYLKEAKIEEMFMLDVEGIVEEFKKLLENKKSTEHGSTVVGQIRVLQDALYRRNKSQIDMDDALALYERTEDVSSKWIEITCNDLRSRLNAKNGEIAAEIISHLHAAVSNVLSAIRYERLQWDGPKIKLLSREHPLVPQYFTYFIEDKALADEEALIYDEKVNALFMAHNGWVMDFDPLRNFADSDFNVYLRRELIAWGDSVKLRFGKEPSDCPFLWDIMKKYVELTARTFHGIRLDNCHSTPLHVAEYLSKLNVHCILLPNRFYVCL